MVLVLVVGDDRRPWLPLAAAGRRPVEELAVGKGGPSGGLRGAASSPLDGLLGTVPIRVAVGQVEEDEERWREAMTTNWVACFANPSRPAGRTKSCGAFSKRV